MDICYVFFFFVKQKTAYEMRISDWSSDVCSSDLQSLRPGEAEILVVHVGAHAHPGGSRGARPVLIVVVEALGHRDGLVLEQAGMTGCRREGAMRRLVVAHEKERAVAIARGEPVQGQVGDEVGGVAAAVAQSVGEI